MEKADVLVTLKEEFTKQDLIESRILLLEGQLRGLERLMETGRDTMKCPTCWNTVASLVEQLQFYIPSVWLTAEENLRDIVIPVCGTAKEIPKC